MVFHFRSFALDRHSRGSGNPETLNLNSLWSPAKRHWLKLERSTSKPLDCPVKPDNDARKSLDCPVKPAMTNTEGRHPGLRAGKYQLKVQSQKLKANSNSLSSHNLVYVLELDVIPDKRPRT